MDNIQSAKYLLDEETNTAFAIHLILLDDKQMSIPINPANRNYAEIMRQVEAGELTIQEAE